MFDRVRLDELDEAAWCRSENRGTMDAIRNFIKMFLAGFKLG